MPQSPYPQWSHISPQVRPLSHNMLILWNHNRIPLDSPKMFGSRSSSWKSKCREDHLSSENIWHYQEYRGLQVWQSRKKPISQFVPPVDLWILGDIIYSLENDDISCICFSIMRTQNLMSLGPVVASQWKAPKWKTCPSINSYWFMTHETHENGF